MYLPSLLQVSPSVQNLLALFESLLVDPGSGSRMAEIARTLGEKRMCKLEIELLTLPVTIYSIEHEALHEALHHLQSMVRIYKLTKNAEMCPCVREKGDFAVAYRHGFISVLYNSGAQLAQCYM